MRAYNMPAFGDQMAALIDHLELDRPIVGGTSLGANAALELAPATRARAPCSSRCRCSTTPWSPPGDLPADPAHPARRQAVLRGIAVVTNRIPRSHYLVDMLLDWTRRPPEASEAVLEGLLFGRTAPPREERELIGLPRW